MGQLKMVKRLGVTFLVSVIMAAFVAVMGYRYLESWSQSPQALPNTQVIQLSKGMTLRGLSESLENQKVIDHWPLFYSWVRVNGLFSRFQAGPYKYELYAKPADIAGDMIAGKIYRPFVVQFTIPEGFNLRKITDRLVANGIGKKEEVWALMRDPKFITSLKIQAATLEGYLYPATYTFTEIPEAKLAIKKMVDTFWERLPANYLEEIAAKKLTLNQAVTFASLIEMETLHLDEKSLVSEVIWRRLNDKVPIGIDASIIYGIENYDGNIRRVHLLDDKNPYNSRIHRGLPPTPIGSVSRESLAAVLTPSNMGYYYYVVDAGTENRHHFSKTLAEHNQYVRKLVRSIQENQRTGRKEIKLPKTN